MQTARQAPLPKSPPLQAEGLVPLGLPYNAHHMDYLEQRYLTLIVPFNEFCSKNSENHPLILAVSDLPSPRRTVIAALSTSTICTLNRYLQTILTHSD